MLRFLTEKDEKRAAETTTQKQVVFVLFHFISRTLATSFH